MSAEIFSAPSSIKVPTYQWGAKDSQEKWRKDEEEYRANLKKFLQDNKKGKNVGEVIRFQVADGYAEYMVASMRPLQLVHLPLGDAYQFQYAHLLNAKEVNEKLEAERKWQELIKKHKK